MKPIAVARDLRRWTDCDRIGGADRTERMVASIALTPPPAPISGAAETSSDIAREDADAFAARLRDDAQALKARAIDAQASALPARDAAPRPAQTNIENAKPAQPTAAPQKSATPPNASADPQDSVNALAATAALSVPETSSAPLAQGGAGSATVSVDTAVDPASAPAPSAQIAPESRTAPTAPLAVASILPAAGEPSPALAPINNTPPEAPFAEAGTATPALIADALHTLAGVDALAVAAAAQAKPAAPETETLRNAGKSAASGVDTPSTGEAKAAGATPSSSSAAAGTQLNTKPETSAAPLAAATSRSADAGPTPAATGETAAVSLETRRAAEAPALAVHRPPTIAATVAQQVIRRFDGHSTSIDVRLDPAELGRVSVKLEVGPDSRVTAVVAAENPATLSDLMRSARELERALESAGLELTEGGLSFDLSGGSGDRARSREPDTAISRAGNDTAKRTGEPAPAASRPFGLESWRGLRVDVTV